ncbi:type II secretion system F family protein [Pseudolysinimonas yzui]|uniref:type II secretion system F family protein n=1 Tax=Pseudolysinimonas yzui TaxID=2708254 RepID=UPI001E366269|nr:type II secretion system F family protein [Pseudolysinimonas yzui]
MVRVTPLIAVAVPVGVTLGLGLWTLLGLVPRVGATRLATRVAPYIADVSPEAREFLDRRPAEPLPFVGGLLAPAGRRIRSALVAVFGGDDSVERRLRQAGWSLTVEALRGRQLLGGVAGAGIGILFAVALARSSAVSPLLLGVVVAVCAAIGVLAPDQLLSRAARARRDRIAAELPTVLEFLTLSLSAGEAVLDALRRVARAGNGDLAREIAIVVAQVNAGVPLAVALERCADEIQLPALSRTVDQLVGALDRGTPLVDVLRAQAQDSRDDAKRSLLEAAGKKEIAMLVPLVFLILPVTVAFAIFPGVMVLQLGF